MLAAIAALALAAGPEDFSTGPVIQGYGPAAQVTGMTAIAPDVRLRLSFDFREPGEEGAPIPGLVTAARFLNMHAQAGLGPERIDLALVVHGRAVGALAAAKSDSDSADADLSAQLIGAGVRIIVCGQSAVYYDVAADDLPDGVELALSAMTAHALLQQEGYALNPF